MAKQQTEPALVEGLRGAIQDSGQSLNQLGKQAGVDHGRLSRFVRGERDLTLAAAGRLCHVLGLRLVGKAAEEDGRKKPPRRPRKAQAQDNQEQPAAAEPKRPRGRPRKPEQ